MAQERSAARTNPRWLGGLAGLAPALAIAGLFATGTAATPGQVAISLGLVALITTSAGWLAGPLAATEPRHLLMAAFGYAIAVIAMNAVLAIAQAAVDTVANNGLDPIAVLTAVVGRAAYAVIASAAYLILPALAAGGAWSLVARCMVRLDRRPR
jgi:hypothetical protein